MSTRSYLVALVDGGGTVPVELGVVRRLVDRGHKVTVLAEDSTRDEVRAAGGIFRSWRRAPNRPDRRPQNDITRDWECKRPWHLVARLSRNQLIDPAPSYAEDTHDALTDTRPDHVLCSMFAVGAMVAAEAACISYDVLFPNIYLLPAPGMPPFGLGLHPAAGPAGRFRDFAIGGFSQRLWDAYGLRELNKLRAGYGLTPVSHVWDQVHHARRELVLTSQAFDFPARLPANARYVGPILDDPVWANRDSWTAPAGQDPLVLVAMSSTFQNHLESLRSTVDAMAQLPVRAVVTTGLGIDPADLSGPANTTIVRAAPHREVLRHAAAVVTHGGHGTVMKTLAAGLPLVVMHHGRDQADNAARVAVRGAGIALARTSKPRAIAAGVRQVLDEESYRANAAALGRAIRQDSDSEALIIELEAMTSQGGNP